MSDSQFVFDKKVNYTGSARVYQHDINANAGFVSRFLAYLVDGLFILLLLCFVEVFLFYFFIQYSVLKFHHLDFLELLATHVSYWGLPAQLISLIYYSYFYLNFDSSPGKMIFDLKVIDFQTGLTLSWSQIFFREFIGKFFSALFFGLGYLLALLRRDGRALHDLIASSQVIRDEY